VYTYILCFCEYMVHLTFFVFVNIHIHKKQIHKNKEWSPSEALTHKHTQKLNAHAHYVRQCQ
jgi:hypothetical protein